MDKLNDDLLSSGIDTKTASDRFVKSHKHNIDIFLHSFNDVHKPYFSFGNSFYLYMGDSLSMLGEFPDDSIDMVFVDPPYFLSNDGTTVRSGKRVIVNKGEWDRSQGFYEDLLFHRTWIEHVYRILKPSGTVWVSGTMHNIYKCGYLLQEIGFHILNDICWYKPNAAPNISCNAFAHAHETLIWAKKNKEHRHYFAYETLKNGNFTEDILKKHGRQMRSVWSIPTPSPSETVFGRHPTQKPLALLKRILIACTKEGDIILDPFLGSGTTGVASLELGKRMFIGIEKEKEYLEIAKKRAENVLKQGRLF